MNKLTSCFVIVLLGLGYSPFDAHARVLVDPFSMPMHTERTKQLHPLRVHPWYDYRLAGILLNQGAGWALLCSSATQCWRLTLGDQFGNQPYRIIRIESTSIVLISLDGSGSTAHLNLDKPS